MSPHTKDTFQPDLIWTPSSQPSLIVERENSCNFYPEGLGNCLHNGVGLVNSIFLSDALSVLKKTSVPTNFATKIAQYRQTGNAVANW